MSTQGLATPFRLFPVFVQWVMQILLVCGLLFSMRVDATDMDHVASINTAEADVLSTEVTNANTSLQKDQLQTVVPPITENQLTQDTQEIIVIEPLPIIADAIYFGGDILTMEGKIATYVEAVVTKDKKIIFVGSKVEAMKFSGSNTKLINISGKTMLPGFIDPHVHPSMAAIMLPNEIIAPYDWILPNEVKKGVSGHFAYLKRLKQSINDNADQDNIFFVWGYHQLWHGALTREILNELSPDKPVVVIHRSFYDVFLNDSAIKKLGLKQKDFADNQQVNWPKGHFYESGWFALADKIAGDLIKPSSYKLGMSIMSRLVLKNGITTIAEPGFPSSNFALEYDILKYEMDKKPPYEVFLIPDGSYLCNAKGRSNENTLAFIETLEKQYNTENIKFLPKQVKLFSDGVIYSQLKQAQVGDLDGRQGERIAPLDILQQQLSFYWENGYQIHVNVNGDLSIQKVLDFNQADQTKLARKDHRLTLHNMEYFSTKQVTQIAQLGIKTSVNPYYLWALAEKYSEIGLDRPQAENLVRVNSLMKNNVPVSFHSDFSMAPLEPLTLAWTAVNRKTSKQNKVSQEERITAYQAMQAITINAAYILRLENSIGSIVVGKKANFTLLEQNPLKVMPMQIKDIPVWGVVFEDQVNTVVTAPKMKKLETRVIYLERKVLPPSSTVTITLEDISKTDISRSILGQKTIVANAAQPYHISLQYDPAQLDTNGQYVVRARIESKGKPLYSATLELPELSQLSVQLFELVVKAIPTQSEIIVKDKKTVIDATLPDDVAGTKLEADN